MKKVKVYYIEFNVLDAVFQTKAESFQSVLVGVETSVAFHYEWITVESIDYTHQMSYLNAISNNTV